MDFVTYNSISTPFITPEINAFSEYNLPISDNFTNKFIKPAQQESQEELKEQEELPSKQNIERKTKPMKSKVLSTSSRGLTQFNKYYDEVEKEMPDAKRYRDFLTKIAEKESGFDSYIQNKAGAPAYGYFQFMDFNIQPLGISIESFRSNPKLQIKAAVNLAKNFESQFTDQDYSLAQQRGYSKNGMLAGAWLAGVGGVRKYLKGQGNPSDRHWSKTGAGTDVGTRMRQFNFNLGGILAFQDGGTLKDQYIKSLDTWIKNHPVYKGINTNEFRDFFIELVGKESSYNKNAKKGSYKGWYQILNPSQDQHSSAFDHLAMLFNESITKFDIEKAKSRNISQASMLMKYWNQQNRATNYLHNNIESTDGNGTKISEWGNDLVSKIDISKYVPYAVITPYTVIQNKNSYAEAVKRARNNFINYSNRESSINSFNKDRKIRKREFNPNKLHIGDTIYLVPPIEYNKFINVPHKYDLD